MSLTHLLKSSNYPAIKYQLKRYFPRPSFDLVGDMLAPPKSKNYGIVGTAFDYLLRFHLERINKEKVVKDDWIAAYGLERLKGHATPLRKDIEISIVNILEGILLYKNSYYGKKYISARNKYLEAEKNYQQFIETGVLSDELIISSIFMAKLDLISRAGLVDKTMFEYDDNDVSDLKLLLSIVPFSDFTSTTKCYLNPTFGEGSYLVGGADADVIIDDTLYDFKVTKKLELQRQYLNQIIGYYVLSQIGGINGDEENKSIKNVGIYFARHGIILKFPISDFNTTENILEFIDWFSSYMKSLWT